MTGGARRKTTSAIGACGGRGEGARVGTCEGRHGSGGAEERGAANDVPGAAGRAASAATRGGGAARDVQATGE